MQGMGLMNNGGEGLLWTTMQRNSSPLSHSSSIAFFRMIMEVCWRETRACLKTRCSSTWGIGSWVIDGVA